MRPAWPWRLFTYCSWLHMFKQTFYNDLIISKKSSRKGIQYVGDITNPRSGARDQHSALQWKNDKVIMDKMGVLSRK